MSDLQELWYVVLESLHRMLLPMLQWDKEGVQAIKSEFLAHHYTNRQCTAIEGLLEILKVLTYKHTNFTAIVFMHSFVMFCFLVIVKFIYLFTGSLASGH